MTPSAWAVCGRCPTSPWRMNWTRKTRPAVGAGCATPRPSPAMRARSGACRWRRWPGPPRWRRSARRSRPRPSTTGPAGWSAGDGGRHRRPSRSSAPPSPAWRHATLIAQRHHRGRQRLPPRACALAALSRRVKAGFDPKGVLNPGGCGPPPWPRSDPCRPCSPRPARRPETRRRRIGDPQMRHCGFCLATCPTTSCSVTSWIARAAASI